MFLKTFFFTLKYKLFLIKKKLKEAMSRKESKFYAINFIDARIFF